MATIKKRTIYCACALIAAGYLSTANAEDPKAIVGTGLSSCTDYLDSSFNDEFPTAFVSWVQGFLSAMNLADRSAGKPFIDLPDAQLIRTHLDAYCGKNPGSKPFEAAILLYRQLRRN